MHAIRLLLGGLILAFLLTSCGASRPVRTELVEVPVEVRVALPPELTAPEPRPARPPLKCRDAAGKATLCERDLVNWLNSYDAALARINDRVARILGLQPAAK
jgi:hypothetical protein